MNNEETKELNVVKEDEKKEFVENPISSATFNDIDITPSDIIRTDDTTEEDVKEDEEETVKEAEDTEPQEQVETFDEAVMRRISSLEDSNNLFSQTFQSTIDEMRKKLDELNASIGILNEDKKKRDAMDIKRQSFLNRPVEKGREKEVVDEMASGEAIKTTIKYF